ncbi:MAG: trimethylamine methyltransferase family protein [Anaerolineae bacterium]|jgi:trimethylamine--corrinoid protein Co-methyltransferase
MGTIGPTEQTPLFRVLNDRQIEKLYHAALQCLDRTGVNVLNAEARDLFAAAGSDVDGVRVRIPPFLVQEAVRIAPRSFTLWERPSGQDRAQDPGNCLHITADRVHYGPGPTCTYFVDPQTGKRRMTRRGDPGLTALVCDALDQVDYVMSLGLISDVEPYLAPVYEFAEMVAQTTKPVLPWAYTTQNVSDIYDIALAVAGSEQALRRRPFLALFTTFQSPLILTNGDMANAFWAAERGVPVVSLGGGTAGTTGPITGAGIMALALAGALASLTALQLKVPGAQVCIGSAPQAMDLRSCRPAYGSPEMSLYCAGMSDVWRHLGVPFMGTGGASEAKVVDLQAAIESTVQVVVSGLSGQPLVHDIGFLDCANIGSLEMLVMNDEIIAMTRRIMRGVEVSDDTLMLDLIDEIGPGGEFISAIETARRCRTEIWHPSLLDRDTWDVWQEAGSPTMQDRVRARVKKILASHRPAPLPDGVAEEIDALLEAAAQREQAV